MSTSFPTLNVAPLILEPVLNQKPEPLTPLQQTILRLKKERNTVILAHSYQIEPIQRIADYVGDSLGLAYKAAETDADVILFCGVHFMAETAKIINPTKTVLLPDLQAGCSLSDACPAKELATYKAVHPDHYIVAYINCSAEVKALSDVICTSSNAAAIVKTIPQDKEILFVPDQNLGQWVAQKTGRRMHLWPGSCYVHMLFTARTLEKLKIQFPDAPIVAHPECLSTVRDKADTVCSTENMIAYCREQSAQTFIIATETGMVHRLRNEIPHKRFVAAPTQNCACNDCRFMKMNTLEKVYDCLRTGNPQVDLPDSILEKAAQPIRRMFKWRR